MGFNCSENCNFSVKNTFRKMLYKYLYRIGKYDYIYFNKSHGVMFYISEYLHHIYFYIGRL